MNRADFATVLALLPKAHTSLCGMTLTLDFALTDAQFDQVWDALGDIEDAVLSLTPTSPAIKPGAPKNASPGGPVTETPADE